LKSKQTVNAITFIVQSHSIVTKDSLGVVRGVLQTTELITLYYPFDFLKTFEDVTTLLTVKCLNPNILEKNVEKVELAFTHESILIIEPDWLISISEIVQCVVDNEINTNLTYYEVFTPLSLSFSIIVGSLANAIFDDLLLDNSKALPVIFEQFLRSKPLIPALLQTASSTEEKRSQLDFLYSKGLELYDSLSHKIQFLPIDSFTLEPQFVSKDYSIVGRLDFMKVHTDAPIIDMIELKSSKAPSFSGNFFFRSIKYPSTMWSSHFIQVVCYQLLLESVYPEKGIRHSILYASENENFLRSVPITNTYKRVCLEVRNKIISAKKAIISKKFSFHKALVNNELGMIPTYSVSEYSTVQAQYKTTSHLLLLYFRSMVYFLENEAIASTFTIGNGNSESTFRSLYFFQSQEVKRKSVYFFDNLRINSWTEGTISLLVSKERDTSLRVGDSVLVYPQNVRPTSMPLLKATVISISNSQIVLKQPFQLSNNLFASYLESQWCLEIDSTQRAVSTMYMKLLSNILWISEEKKSLLLGISIPQKNCITLTSLSNKRITSSQIRAIEGALNAKDYFLIQGPPGTGKTSVVLAEIVKNIIENSNETILIVAYTNKVVDELCSMVVRLGFCELLIRLGSTQTEEVKPFLLSNVTSSIPLKEVSTELLKKRICISTVASIASNPEIFLLWKFQTVIFDEAAQIVEAYCIGIASYCERSIFIGDEKQLPAIVVQDKKDTILHSKDLQEIGLINLSESLFSRLLSNAKKNNWIHCISQLQEQGRMHSDIQQLANLLFYQNQLLPLQASQISQNQLFGSSQFLVQSFQNSRVLFFNINYKSRSIEEQILSLVDKLVIEFTNFAPTLRIGIISPFRKFNHTILQHFASKNVQNIDIDTVERFQGSEREIIIYCVPIIAVEQFESIQSLSLIDGVIVDRKLNVAITRAKEYFVLCGSAELLQLSEQYQQLLGLLPNIQWH